MARDVSAEEVVAATTRLRRDTDEQVEFVERLYATQKSVVEQRDRLSGELASEQQKCAGLTQTVAERDGQIEQLKQDAASQKAEHERQLAEKDKRHAEEMGALQQQLDAERKQHESKLAELNDRIDGLCKDVEHLKDTVAHKEKEIADVTSTKDAIIADLHRQVGASEATVKGIMFMRHNVDAFHLQSDHINEPVAACILPDGCILVADTMQGILMFSPHTELVQRCTSAEWKWPQGLCYDTAKGRVLVTCMKRRGDGSFRRAIQCFDVQPDELQLYHRLTEAETIDCPEDAQVDTHLAKERLAQSYAGDIYMTLADALGSALYKYEAAGGGWHCLSKRQGQIFSDLAVLQADSPITEVLLVESKMGYLHKFSVRGADVAQRSSIACVERPACLAVDERNNIFVQDVISGKVHQLNARFEVCRDVCLIDDSVFSVTASHGCLGVAVREHKTVRVFRFGEYQETEAKPKALEQPAAPPPASVDP